MFSSLKNKIIEENRLLNVDLFEFCSKSSNIQNLDINTSKTVISAEKSNKNENKMVSEHTKESNDAQKESTSKAKTTKRSENPKNLNTSENKVKSDESNKSNDTQKKSISKAKILKKSENPEMSTTNENKVENEHSNESNDAQKDTIVNVKIPRKTEKSENYGRIKSLLDIDKLENEFKSKNYAEIIKEFENCFNKYPNSRIYTQHLNFLTHALYKNVSF